MSDSQSAESSDTGSRKTRKTWNYTPDLPIQISPFFKRPFDFTRALKWILGGWFPLTERLIILCIAVVSWVFFHPSIERTREFAPDWIAEIYLRNLILIFLVAGFLHLYFYILRRQGDQLRYDARPLVKNNRVFTFNSQVRDNMFWSCASGVSIWTAFEVIMMWALANGYLPTLNLPSELPLFVLLILLLPAWETLHFFLIHRLIHWPPLFRLVHSLHHRNINVGPWSGMSMHPVEHAIYLSTVLIHFIVPAHPLLLLFHLQYFTLSAVTTHTGYQGLIVKGRMILPLGTFHHQLHHRFFECNYGGLEVPMDKWTGNFHNGTAESHQEFVKRRRNKVKA